MLPCGCGVILWIRVLVVRSLCICLYNRLHVVALHQCFHARRWPGWPPRAGLVQGLIDGKEGVWMREQAGEEPTDPSTEVGGARINAIMCVWGGQYDR